MKTLHCFRTSTFSSLNAYRHVTIQWLPKRSSSCVTLLVGPELRDKVLKSQSWEIQEHLGMTLSKGIAGVIRCLEKHTLYRLEAWRVGTHQLADLNLRLPSSPVTLWRNFVPSVC